MSDTPEHIRRAGEAWLDVLREIKPQYTWVINTKPLKGNNVAGDTSTGVLGNDARAGSNDLRAIVDGDAARSNRHNFEKAA